MGYGVSWNVHREHCVNRYSFGVTFLQAVLGRLLRQKCNYNIIISL
jgi:hypothetical protein